MSAQTVATVRERPILFSAPMIRALLAGTKTQTRRIVNPQPLSLWGQGVTVQDPAHYSAHVRTTDGEDRWVRSPYGRPGDRLWVRESWRSWEETCEQDHPHGYDVPCGLHCHQVYVAYAATPREGYRPTPDKAHITYLDASTPLEANPLLLGPWRPSIFMPRCASRITLEVTEVRVQRLQEISEEDARAEGFSSEPTPATVNGEPAELHVFDPIKWYALLWDSVNGKRAPWSSNPWVWALTFRRVA